MTSPGERWKQVPTQEMGERGIPGLITIQTGYNLLNSLQEAMFYILPGQTGASQANQAFNCG